MGLRAPAERSLLTDDLLAFYRKNGYCLIENVLTEPDCEKYRRYAETIAEKQAHKYSPVINPDRSYPLFRDLLCLKAIVRILEKLQGGRIMALQSLFYFKPPGSLGRDLHQDNFYARTDPDGLVGTWIAIDDSDRENGGLVAYPGSHREGLLDVVVDEERKKTNAGDFQNDRGVYCQAPPQYSKVYVSAPAGSVVLMHGHLIHGSENNLSKTRFRRAFAGHYAKEGLAFTPGHHAKRTRIDVYD